MATRINRATLNIITSVIANVKDGTPYDPADVAHKQIIETLEVALFDAIAFHNGWKATEMKAEKLAYFKTWMLACESDKDRDPAYMMHKAKVAIDKIKGTNA